MNRDIWHAAEGEVLPCSRELHNLRGLFAAAIQKDSMIVGHAPRLISADILTLSSISQQQLVAGHSPLAHAHWSKLINKNKYHEIFQNLNKLKNLTPRKYGYELFIR